MARQPLFRLKHVEPHKKPSRMRDFILGWQDGLVNVLGVILGVATATSNVKLIIIAAMAATFAESISMMAVSYTSFKAEADFYRSELNREIKEMRDEPEDERDEVRSIFSKMGFAGPLLAKAVRAITSNRKRWLDFMMENELKLSPAKFSPVNIALVVGASAFIGSFIPTVPFFLLPVQTAVYVALTISLIVLFFVGAYKTKTTVGNPIRGGIELAAIGMLAALAGFGIGALMGAVMA
jgi:VIT1/CCC1 family predicted Fe2+/Mn2+ transporter